MMRLFFLAAAAALLSGCAGFGISGRDDGERWALTGKLGVRTAEQAESALLNWTQCGDSYRLVISGPFGQQLARVEGNRMQALIWVEDAPPQLTSDLQNWLDQNLGWPLPMAELRYWVRGRAAPGRITAEKFDQQQRLIHWQQRGWQVDITRYHQADGIALPERLKAQREPLRSTLLIRQWQLGEEVTCPGS